MTPVSPAEYGDGMGDDELDAAGWAVGLDVWGLESAEAVLKLRAMISNGDLDAYWSYHLDQEHQRIHKARYANNTIPKP